MNPSHPRFCDWRVYVNPLCEDYAFFRTALFVFLAIAILNACMLFYCLVFRKLVLKDTWTSYLSGLNRSLIFFTMARFTAVTQLSMTLSGANRVATEIMFILHVSVCFFSIFNHLSMIIAAIPGLKSDRFKIPDFILNQKIRRALLLSYQAAVFIIISVILGLSEHYFLIGQEELSDRLWIAGFAFAAPASSFFPLFLLSFFFYHFSQASSARLEVIQGSNVRAEKKETKILVLTIDKIKKAFYFMFPGSVVLGVFYVLLASYHNLFFDLGASKAFCIIFYLTEASAALLTVQFIRSDILKFRTKKEGPSEDSYSLRRNDTKELSANQLPSKLSEDPIDNFLEVAKTSAEN